MRIRKFFLTSSLLSSLVLGLFFNGCAENNTTLFIDRAVPALAAEECIVEFSEDSLFLSRGVYDSSVDCGYRLNLQVGNQLQSLADSTILRAETSRIAIEGAEVKILDSAKNEVVPEFSTNQNGIIDPSTGNSPGYGGLIIEVIPPGLDLASGEYVVRVRVFGSTLGNTPVESNYFFFPITVGVQLESAACPVSACNVGQDTCFVPGLTCGI